MDCFDFPKIIHVFEEDNQESSHQIMLKSLHPDWLVYQWNPGKIIELIHHGMISNSLLSDYQKLQIIKIETLTNFGGIWIDKGINLVTPLDSFIRNTDHLFIEDLKGNIDPRLIGFSKNHKACWAYLQRVYPRVGEFLDNLDEAFSSSWLLDLVEEKIGYSLVLPYRCLPYEEDKEAKHDFKGFLGFRKNHEHT